MGGATSEQTVLGGERNLSEQAVAFPHGFCSSVFPLHFLPWLPLVTGCDQDLCAETNPFPLKSPLVVFITAVETLIKTA